jgi:hypothetical protein
MPTKCNKLPLVTVYSLTKHIVGLVSSKRPSINVQCYRGCVLAVRLNLVSTVPAVSRCCHKRRAECTVLVTSVRLPCNRLMLISTVHV